MTILYLLNVTFYVNISLFPVVFEEIEVVNLNEDLERITITPDIIEQNDEEDVNPKQKRRDLKRTGSKSKMRKRGKNSKIETFQTCNLLHFSSGFLHFLNHSIAH